jgi:hypothetical protein
VCIRTANIPDHQIVRAELARDQLNVPLERFPAVHAWLERLVARAQHPRNVRDVGEPVLGTAEPRMVNERGVELAELDI